MTATITELDERIEEEVEYIESIYTSFDNYGTVFGSRERREGWAAHSQRAVGTALHTLAELYRFDPATGEYL